MNRCIVSFFCIIFLFFSLNSFAQSWEVVYEEGFSGIVSLGDISNLTHYGYNLSGYGSNGSSSDTTSYTNPFFQSSNTVYLAFRFDNLDAQYEYRLKCNAKSIGISGRKLQFRYNTQAASTGIDIGSSIIVPMVSSSTSPGSVLTSDAFSGLNGQHYLIIAPDPNNQPITYPVYIDDFTLERRLVSSSSTVLSFAAATLSVNEGQSVQVCVSIANPSSSLATTVDVALDTSSTASPHFDGFTTQTLTFPADSSGQQCFTLQTDSDDGIAAGVVDYIFSLGNMSGGNNPQLGSPSQVVVSVVDDPMDQTINFPPISDKVATTGQFAISATATSGYTVDFTLISGPASISGNLLTLDGVIGTVIIEANQPGDTLNYNAAPSVRDTFEVIPATQTINFPAIPLKVVTSLPFTPSVSATSGLPVTISVVSGPATVDTTNTVTLTGIEGIVVLEANQSGDSTYSAAAAVQQSFEVTEVECTSSTRSTDLEPGDLVFIGFDNDIALSSPDSLPSGSDRIVLTNMKPILPCTEFSLFNANFVDSLAENFSTWSTLVDGEASALIPSQLIRYEGFDTLPIGSVICFDLPSQVIDSSNTLARNFHIDGAPTGNFSVIQNNGLNDIPIDLAESEQDAIYLMQGHWKPGIGFSHLVGDVISALVLGGVTNIPSDLECAQPPVFPVGSKYGYFNCSAFGNEFTRFDYLDLALDTTNWNLFSGDGMLNDLGPLADCDQACDVTIEFPITLTAEPATLLLDCSSDVQTAIDSFLNVNYGGIIATTTCPGGIVTITSSSDTTSYEYLQNACTDQGAIVLFHVEDSCGNYLTVEGHIEMVNTNLVPYFTTYPQDTAVTCNSMEEITATLDSWIENMAGAEAADDCGIVYMDIETEILGYSCNIMDSVKAIVTIEDVCGNTRKDSAYFYVVDNTIPVVTTPPSSLTIDCNDPDFELYLNQWVNNGGYGEATDSCGYLEAWEYTGLNLSNISCGTYNVYFRASDGCGNLSSIQWTTLTVTDTVPPVIISDVKPQEIRCDDPNYSSKMNNWLNAHGHAVVSDQCGALSWSNNYSGQLPISECGTIVEIEFEVSDECGNTATLIGNVEIVDHEEPEFLTEPLDLNLYCSGGNNSNTISNWLLNNGGGLATDNCDTAIVWSNDYSGQLDSVYCGQTQVFFSIADDCGLTNVQSAIISITDSLFSVVNQGSDLQLSCTCGEVDTTVVNSWLASNANIQVSSGCSNVTIENSGVNLFDLNRCQDWDVDFMYTNSCGDELTVTRSIFFTNPPCTITWDTIPQDIYVTCGQDAQQMVQDWVDDLGGGVVSGNCIDTVIHNYSVIKPESCESTGQIVSFIAIDTCNSLNIVTAKIFLEQDTLAPVLQTPASDTTYSCVNQGDLSTTLQNWLDDYGGASAIDSCTSLEWSYSPNPIVFQSSCISGVSFSKYVDVIFTASDYCGNAVSTTARFEVIDNENPTVITPPQDTTLNCNDPNFDTDFQEWINTGMAEVTDNCGGYLVWTSTYAGELDGVTSGSVTVDFTVSDTDCDVANSVTLSATLTIVDDEVTLASEGNDLEVDCNGTNQDDLIQNWLDNNANAISADCSTVTWTNNVDEGSLNDSLSFWQGIYNCEDQVVTIIVIDSLGNEYQFDREIIFISNCPSPSVEENCMTSKNDIIFVLDNSESIATTTYLEVQYYLSGFIQNLLSISGLDLQYAIVQGVDSILVSVDYTTNSSVSYSRAFTEGEFEPNSVFTALYNKVDTGQLAPRLNSQLHIIIITDATADQMNPYGGAFSLKSSSGLGATVSLLRINEDAPGNAACAAVASLGGSYVGLVSSVNGDPDGQGTRPRRFINGKKIDDLFTQLLPELTGCYSLQANYNGQCSGSLTYNWEVTDTSGQIYQQYGTGEIFINGQGTYAVTITCSTGCTVDTTHSISTGQTLSAPNHSNDEAEIELSDLSENVETGQDETLEQKDDWIRIFPNPTSNEVFIHVFSLEEQIMELHFIDPSGRTVLTDNRFLRKGDNQFRYNTRSLPSGVYLLRTQTNRGVFFDRLTVIKR